MNILIINGSPRRQGLISQMLGIMRDVTEAQGASVETVLANDLVAKPCIGCMACRTKRQCVLPEDDSQRLLAKIASADAIIIGSPCYWGNIPGQLKLLFDRMVYGLMRDTPRFPEPLMKGKKCVLVSTCTTPWPFSVWFNQSRGAIKALKEICRYSGFDIVATIEKSNTRNNTTLSEREIAKCRKIATKLTK